MNNKFVDLMDLYYFWNKYQSANVFNFNQVWNGERTKKQFELMLESKLIELKIMPKQQGTYTDKQKQNTQKTLRE